MGEPDFPTPSHIVDAAHEAARRYTTCPFNAGLSLSWCEVLADKVIRRNGYEARPEQVVVTQGAFRHLYLVLRALLEPGDEAMSRPAWPNFRMISHLLGARVLGYPWSQREISCLAPKTSSARVTPRTRAP